MMRDKQMLKVKPPPEYPPEEGRYLRGNDYSPVAVVVILNRPAEDIPPSIEALVRVAVESGAALAGTLQTENIGLEKVICNVIANPNIRYIVVCGPESAGHLVGDAIISLMKRGIDERRSIIGAKAPHPYLYNVSVEAVQRFREQVSLVNLLNEGHPEVVGDAVWSCYQETPVKFKDYTLYDVGAYPEEALCTRITWRVSQPWAEPRDEEERKAKQRYDELVKRLRERRG